MRWSDIGVQSGAVRCLKLQPLSDYGTGGSPGVGIGPVHTFVVPEPGTAWLVAIGLLGLGLRQ